MRALRRQSIGTTGCVRPRIEVRGERAAIPADSSNARSLFVLHSNSKISPKPFGEIEVFWIYC